MAIPGEHIKKFLVCKVDKENQDYSEIFNYKLINTHSKHIAYINEMTHELHKLSLKVDYNIDVIGSHRNTTLEDERQRIQNMKNSSCLRAARFVICSDSRIWADNTHWTIAYILKFGNSVTLKDIPSYVVDFRNDIPIIIEYDNILFDSMYCIKSAIACAKRIQDRLDKGWRPINTSFTINDLIKDLYNNYNFNYGEK